MGSLCLQSKPTKARQEYPQFKKCYSTFDLFPTKKLMLLPRNMCEPYLNDFIRQVDSWIKGRKKLLIQSLLIFSMNKFILNILCLNLIFFLYSPFFLSLFRYSKRNDAEEDIVASNSSFIQAELKVLLHFCTFCFTL